MNKGSAYEGFAALYDGTGNDSVTVVETVGTSCVLDYELVRKVQMHGDKPHRGDPIGRFPELWPFDLVKRALLEQAHEFVRQIGTQGFVPVTNVEQFKVWGPYTEKVGDPHDFVPEATNHTIPKSEKQTASTVWGYQDGELSVDKGVAFRIMGRFMRPTKYGHVSEEDGRILV